MRASNASYGVGGGDDTAASYQHVVHRAEPRALEREPHVLNTDFNRGQGQLRLQRSGRRRWLVGVRLCLVPCVRHRGCTLYHEPELELAADHHSVGTAVTLRRAQAVPHAGAT